MMRHALGLLLALAAPGGGEGRSGEHVLQDRQYEFCRDAEYPLYDFERAWCDDVGDRNAVCPRLPDACQSGVRPADDDGSPNVKRSCSGRKPGPGGGGTGRGSGSGSPGGGTQPGRGGAARGGARPGGAGDTGDSRGGDRPGRAGDDSRTPGAGSGSGQPGAAPPGSGRAPGSGREGARDGQRAGDQAGRGRDGRSARRGKGDRRSQKRSRRAQRPEEREVKAPPPASGLAQMVFFLLIALGLGALVWAIFRNASWSRRPDEDELEPDELAAGGESAAPQRRVIETDVQRLLDRARRAAGQGQHEQAIEHAYAAALRSLEHEGLIDMHSSSTNGDYVRALRPHPELAQGLGSIVTQVERVQFGAARPDGPLFEWLMQRVMPIVQRASLLVVMMAGTALWGCLEQPAQEGYLPGRGDATPSGTRAVVEHLGENGIQASYRLRPLGRIDSDVGVLVVMPSCKLGGHEEAVSEWVQAGGRLVLAGVLPEMDGFDLEQADGTATDSRLVPTGELGAALHDLEMRVPAQWALRPTAGSYEWDAFLTRSGWEGAEAYAFERQLEEGDILAFADERLFTNIALAVAQNDQALLRLLRGKGKVQLCDDWTGSSASSPLAAVGRARLTPVIAQLLALLLLLFLYKGIAFGRLRDPMHKSRRSFVDHVRAVGVQYARAGASEHVAGVYAAWALERLRERVPRGRHYDLEELAEALAPRVRRPAEEIARLLRDAQAVVDAWGPTTMRPGSLRDAQAAPRSGAEGQLLLMRQLTHLLAAATSGRPTG